MASYKVPTVKSKPPHFWKWETNGEDDAQIAQCLQRPVLHHVQDSLARLIIELGRQGQTVQTCADKMRSKDLGSEWLKNAKQMGKSFKKMCQTKPLLSILVQVCHQKWETSMPPRHSKIIQGTGRAQFVGNVSISLVHVICIILRSRKRERQNMGFGKVGSCFTCARSRLHCAVLRFRRCERQDMGFGKVGSPVSRALVHVYIAPFCAFVGERGKKRV